MITIDANTLIILVGITAVLLFLMPFIGVGLYILFKIAGIINRAVRTLVWGFYFLVLIVVLIIFLILLFELYRIGVLHF